MKILKATLLISLLLLSCSEKGRKEEKQEHQVYSDEQEKLLNEVFLKIIGTERYFTLTEENLEEAYRILEREGEKAQLKFYETHKIEDPTRLIIFIQNGFVSFNSSEKRSARLHSMHLPYIKQALVENKLISKNDSGNVLLNILSQPLIISNINLTQTGRYELVKEEDSDKLKGKFKAYGVFNCSKIYFDKQRTKACFYYERDCLEGTKCASGNLVLLEKRNGYWQICKEVSIYQT